MSNYATTGLKRDRDNGAPPLPSKGAASVPPPLMAGEPVKKRARSFFASLANRSGTQAPASARSTRKSGGATCYAVVMEPWEHAKSDYLDRKSGAQKTFHRVTFQAAIGMVDVEEGGNALVDETTDELVFSIADPSYGKDKADEAPTIQKRFEMFNFENTHRVTVTNKTSLPEGVVPGAVVRLDGLRCDAYVHKQSGQINANLSARDVVIPKGMDRSAAAVIQFLRETGVQSTWYHEGPMLSAQEMDKNSPYVKPRTDNRLYGLPIVHKEDAEGLETAFPPMDPQRYLWSTAYDASGPGRWFKPPPGANDNRQPGDPIVSGADAGFDNCTKYHTKAEYTLHIQQWDKTRNPLQGENNALKYEPILRAGGADLWSFGVSHPTHQMIMSLHARFFRGFSLFVSDAWGTSKYPDNIERNMAIQSMGGPDAAGPGTKQLVSTFVRSMILDVPQYLEAYGLPCSFELAAELLGFGAATVAQGDKTLPLRGLVGTYMTRAKPWRNPPVESVEKEAYFQCSDFVCLNAVKNGNLRDEAERISAYYVLTCFEPKSFGDLQAIGAAASQMTDDHVRSICQLTKDLSKRDRVMLDAARDQSKAPILAFIESCNTPVGVNPANDTFLVFGIRRPKDELARRRAGAALDIVAKAWRAGPVGAIQQGTAPTRLNVPAEDDVDLPVTAAPAPDADGDTAMSDADGPLDASRRFATDDAEGTGSESEAGSDSGA